MIVNNLNDQQQWDDIYAAYSGELEAFVNGRLGVTEAEDLLQETWSALATALTNTEIQQPRAWLYRVARNRITDLHRRTSGRPAFQDLTPEIDAYEESYAYPDQDETWTEIEAALAELPEDQYEVFVRNELDSETLREIAEDLGLPLKTIISRKGYARRRLQVSLRDLYEEYFGTD